MTTLLVTERQDRTFIACERSRVRVRLAARLRAWALDTALANGASPDSSAALSLRAHRLISHATRRHLAREIHRIQREARRPARFFFNPGVPICLRKIVCEKPALDELARELLTPGPVEASGVARVRLLLRDGASPLYSRSSADDLEPALEAAIDALQPRL